MRKLAALFMAMLLSAGPALAGGTFETLPLGGSFFPGSVLMSADGSVLAGYWNASFYYYTEDGGVAAVPVGAALPPTLNISGDGTTLVATQVNADDGKEHAATFDIPTLTWTMLDDADGTEGCDASFSSAWAASFDASRVVGMSWIPGCDAEATRWDGGTPTLLGRFDPTSSRVSAVSDDGALLGGWAEHPSFGMRRPAIWTDDVDGPQLIADPENDAGEVLAVSPDGSAVVGVRNSFAFYYDMATSTMTDIGALYGDPYGSSAYDVSGDGTVVGMSGSLFWSTPYGFIWTQDTGIMYLGDYLTAMGVQGYDGQTISAATAISNDGSVISGYYLNPDDFKVYPFVAHIEDIVPVALSSFEVAVSPGQVDFRFLLFGDATADDLVLTATKDGAQWNVPVNGEGTDFSARDNAAQILEGGSIDYALYARENGELQLLRSRNVDLGSQMLANRLLGAFTNPFNPKTSVAFTLSEAQRVRLSVFDLGGRQVATLADQVFAAGQHSVEWNGRTAGGEAAASGIYFVRMASPSGTQLEKITLMK